MSDSSSTRRWRASLHSPQFRESPPYHAPSGERRRAESPPYRYVSSDSSSTRRRRAESPPYRVPPDVPRFTPTTKAELMNELALSSGCWQSKI